VRGTGDELDRLAETLNGMLARLENTFGEMRRFSADAAHELRTPLTALKGTLEVALRTDRSVAEYQDALTSALEEVDRLVRLAEDLLLMSRATAGPEAPRARVDVEPLVLDVAEVGARLGKERGVAVRVGPVAPAVVLGDAGALRRALLNLVENGAKYTPAGGRVELTASTPRAPARPAALASAWPSRARSWSPIAARWPWRPARPAAPASRSACPTREARSAQMQTALGVFIALAGVAIVVAPWALALVPAGPVTVALETMGVAVALLGLALSHRVFPGRRTRQSHRRAHAGDHRAGRGR